MLGLPTGSSPEIIYKLLVQKFKNGDVSFRNVVTFNMVRPINISYSLLRADASGPPTWANEGAWSHVKFALHDMPWEQRDC